MSARAPRRPAGSDAGVAIRVKHDYAGIGTGVNECGCKDETLRATLIESYHFEALVGDLIASGMEPNEALPRARLQFGGLEQIGEQCREYVATGLNISAKI